MSYKRTIFQKKTKKKKNWKKKKNMKKKEKMKEEEGRGKWSDNITVKSGRSWREIQTLAWNWEIWMVLAQCSVTQCPDSYTQSWDWSWWSWWWWVPKSKNVCMPACTNEAERSSPKNFWCLIIFSKNGPNYNIFSIFSYEYSSSACGWSWLSTTSYISTSSISFDALPC